MPSGKGSVSIFSFKQEFFGWKSMIKHLHEIVDIKLFVSDKCKRLTDIDIFREIVLAGSKYCQFLPEGLVFLIDEGN